MSLPSSMVPPGETARVIPPRGRAWILRVIGRGMSSQLRVNMLSGVATTVANVAVMAASYPLYLYLLGYQKVGVWLLLSSVQMFTQLGLLGIGPALTKLVAEERGRGDNAAAQKYISLATTVLLVTGGLALAVIWLFRAEIVSSLGLTDANAAVALRLLPWVGLLTAFSFMNQITTAALSGIGRMDMANYYVTAGKIIALMVEAVLLVRHFGVVTLLVGDFVGCAIIHVAGLIYLRRRAGLHMLRGLGWDATRLRRLMNFGGSMFVASITTLLVSPLNKMALSRYAGVALVPVYDIAFNGSMQLRGLAEVGMRALMPAVSHRDADGTADSRLHIRQMHARALRWIVLLATPAYALALLIGRPLLRVWLGHRFVPEIVPTFDIMLTAALVNLASVPAYYTLMGMGHVRSCMVSHFVSASANVLWIGGALALHGTLSVYAASFAVLATMTGSTIYLLLRVYRIMGIAPAAPAEVATAS